MTFISYLFFGFFTAMLGSIVPSYLNLTVVKFSLKNGKKPTLYLIGGFATTLFFQANLGAYLANVLMGNTAYIILIQKIGIGILLLLSFNFFRLYCTKNQTTKNKELKKSKAYLQGFMLSILNTFAIPFYFTSISLLISWGFFEYSLKNSLYFSIGSTMGSFTLYAIYGIIAKKIENKLVTIANKMDLILGCFTSLVAIGNLIYLLNRNV